MKLNVLKGTTSFICHVFIQDSTKTDGSGLTGLTNSTCGTLAYMRAGASAAVTGITINSIATLGTFAGTATQAAFKEVDSTNMPGVYELQLPNNALASGANQVVFMLKGGANAAPLPLEIQLTGYDPNDATRLGLTALPNAAANATGGLTADVVRGGTAQGGGGSTITLDSGANATTNFYRGQIVNIVGGTGVGQTRCIASYVGSTKIATVDRAWITNPDATSVFTVLAADNPALTTTLQVSTSGINEIIRSGTAQAGGNNTITLDAGASGVDNTYQYDVVSITGGTGVGQSRVIISYTGSTKVATVNSNWSTNPDSTSTFEVTPTAFANAYFANVTQWLGTAVSASTAGIPDTNIVRINNGLTNGNNATLSLLQLNIVNSGGDAIVATSSGSNGNGINASGNGTGNGIKGTGGASGNSVNFLGPLKGQTLSNFEFLLTDSNGNPVTGATVSANISKDGGAFAAAAAGVTEVSNGIYKISPTTVDMGFNLGTFRFSATGARDTDITMQTVP